MGQDVLQVGCRLNAESKISPKATNREVSLASHCKRTGLSRPSYLKIYAAKGCCKSLTTLGLLISRWCNNKLHFHETLC